MEILADVLGEAFQVAQIVLEVVVHQGWVNLEIQVDEDITELRHTYQFARKLRR